MFGFVVWVCFSSIAYAQDLSDAKAICNDLNDSNRAMAKAAGYDVDSLCQSLNSVGKETVLAPQVSTKVASRSTISSANARTDADIVDSPATPIAKPDDARAKLKPFGYDLFANVPSTFAGSTNVPVSSDYLLGPGDELAILFYGKLNQSFKVQINRDGIVDFPELGPTVLAGLTFGEAKGMLQSLVATQVIGTQVNVSMGALRSMQIFVLGEAYKPGAYTVSSLATITHALMSAGGVSDIASLRGIQLKRAGKTVAVLDLYELLLFGNISNDVRLQSSDVIYVPTVGDLVSVDGEVLRPAIYELKSETTAGELVALAGGLGSKAFGKRSRVDRIDGNGFMTVVDVDLTSAEGKQMAMVAGDHLSIDAIADYQKDIVTLEGYAYHPGDFAWRSGMRVSDLISNADQFPPDVDLDYALIIRELAGGHEIEARALDLRSVINDPNGSANVNLLSRDRLLIFSVYADRNALLEPVLAKLSRQSKLDGSAKIIVASGKVRFPGQYPLVAGMSISDLVTAAGGLSEGAYEESVEVTRSDLSDPEKAMTISLPVSMASASDFELSALDDVFFKTMPDYGDSQSILLVGEVVFPGEYTFHRGETLTSVIDRAGGFTDKAHIDAAFFTREKLKQRERMELERLRERLNEELVAGQLVDVNSGLEVDSGQQAIQQKAIAELNSVEAIGRLVFPLQDIIDGNADDVLLESGDQLLVPRYRQEVSVIGEVQQSTSYFHDRSFSVQDYIEQSGGLLDSADSRRIYVVKASGQMVIPKRSSFFARKNMKVDAGDTIVVPLDTDNERVEGITLISEVSKIVYELALGAAAINSLKGP
jgi:protein involved in polysaccharide export with SLBB domain